jgi:hypothetical protein
MLSERHDGSASDTDLGTLTGDRVAAVYTADRSSTSQGSTRIGS